MKIVKAKSLQYSPRVWRWSFACWSLIAACFVFSTGVEVILDRNLKYKLEAGILHVCGGDPDKRIGYILFRQYSPRVWRWSWTFTKLITWGFVFSTCVEVIPTSRLAPWKLLSILHVCGGDPDIKILGRMTAEYSPRVWRWSLLRYQRRSSISLFSTCVEVISSKNNCPC